MGTLGTRAFKGGVFQFREKMISMYHSEVTDERQLEILKEFTKSNSKIRCLIVSSAFGMGVNIPDISLVFHWGEPESVLAYWQQIGRAGRDGRQASAIMLHNGNQLHSQVEATSRQVFRSLLENPLTCIRHTIMKSLHVIEMGDLPPPPPTCNNKCHEAKCLCAGCKCCSGCWKRCVCNQKE